MKKIVFALFLPTLLLFSVPALAQRNNSAEKSEVQAVSSVDLKRFAGKWFEIARYPNKNQKICVGNTTLTYTETANEKVSILGQCVKKNGTTESITTEAKIADKTTSAKFSARSAPGNFWIIDLDPDYKYAAVADPKRENLWILSREPDMKDAVYQNILRRVETMGFKPGKLVKTPQNIEVVKGAAIVKQ